MANDFNNFGHKNAELLRHYIVKEIRNIDKKLSSNWNMIIGCFVASFVDVLVVMLFENFFTNLGFIYKLLWLVILIVSFIGIAIFVSFVLKKRRIDYLIEGKQKYDRENIEKYIDEFDNTACDGLLICQNYINKYRLDESNNSIIKRFYYYEILHHLKKSLDVFEIIGGRDKNLYVRNRNNDGKYKIAEYRIKNFISLSNEILEFLRRELENNSVDEENLLKNDIEILSAKLKEKSK